MSRAEALDSFVDRLYAGPAPDLDEVHRIRHVSRVPVEALAPLGTLP